MGTPEFAVASLRALVEAGHEICGVFTQPDKPKNRGHKLAFSPVKEYALTQNLPVYQPVRARDSEVLELVRSLNPELIVAAAYGQLLPEALLETPSLGSINVHSSLLPKYRGAAPINRAILDGETETGVSIMDMVKELDAGDVIVQRSTPIGPGENAQTLALRSWGPRLCWRPWTLWPTAPPSGRPRGRTGPMRPCSPGRCLPWTGAAAPMRSAVRSGD